MGRPCPCSSSVPRRFTGAGSKWSELPAEPGAAAGAVKTILAPLQAAASATTVTADGDVYHFVPTGSDRFLTSLLGVRASALSAPRLSATVRGGTVATESIAAVDGDQRLEVDLTFSAVGSSPPVTTPAASSRAPTP